MDLLLDTHALIWFLEGDASLSETARKAIENIVNKKYISIISFYEIAIKLKTGKLKLRQPLNNYFQSALSYDIVVLPINEKYLSEYDNIPLFPVHKDPFDRLIIATAVVEKLEIITIDEKFSNYHELVSIVW
ncbi:type II toxin-antitoxin system VapC family toxin [Parafilimonas terrae]|uniref:PIN domain nuclease, a component of toxin-antitoxin system (PIN domain) n=1 Tax=Parafilimonas terrae TaxID=1465490 RepID=A0A1I5YFY8_9BACT|nr:type II toxin-antitoxin system VapC family toxin [Parafilimonas terrae]SFQ43125.1 PIN domain nuclease, a component of toxin-antitoxin system (PIN domain) [Parafilimonas terrae]